MLENIELFGNSLGVGTYPDGEGKSFLQNIFDVIHPVGEVYIQYPAQKSPQEIYNKKDANNRIIIDSVWEEQLQYNSAFFRSEHLLGSYIYKADDETQYYLIDNLNNLTPINIAGNNDVTIAGSPTSGQQKVIGDKTYQAYAVSGVNSSSDDYIKEGNPLSIQGNQNAYHNHGGYTGNNDVGHTHNLNSANAKATSTVGRPGDRWVAYTGDNADTGTGFGTGMKLQATSFPSTVISVTTTLSGRTEGQSANHKHSIPYDGSSTDTEARPDNFTVKIWKRIS